MTKQLPDLVERVTTLDHQAVMLSGYIMTARRSPLGVVRIHMQDLEEITEALGCYGIMLQAEVRAYEQQAAQPDLPIVSTA